MAHVSWHLFLSWPRKKKLREATCSIFIHFYYWIMSEVFVCKHVMRAEYACHTAYMLVVVGTSRSTSTKYYQLHVSPAIDVIVQIYTSSLLHRACAGYHGQKPLQQSAPTNTPSKAKRFKPRWSIRHTSTELFSPSMLTRSQSCLVWFTSLYV